MMKRTILSLNPKEIICGIVFFFAQLLVIPFAVLLICQLRK